MTVASARAESPVTLTGRYEPSPSRGLWLVKWLLAIPHYIVLFFLLFALSVTTIISGFAILFTGRYPRSLFDFAVGVLRWAWRVAFYSYSALGTDEYPPFTLQRTGYPADFDVAYPERLSQGLVLVKWWLLAIPHYIIVGAITGSTWTVWSGGTDAGESTRGASASLLGALVIISAFILLFTGVYPRAMFDFIMGLNRWVWRVVGYSTLLTDVYPPFRLDPGEAEPRRGTSPTPGKDGDVAGGSESA
jgi:hypothetical protein